MTIVIKYANYLQSQPKLHYIHPGVVPMSNFKVQTDKYQLVKPIVNKFLTGTKTLEARVILSGQIDNIVFIKSFANYQEVIMHMCKNNNYFGATMNPESYQLLAVVDKKYANSEFIDFKDIKIKPCPKSLSRNTKFLEFELDELSFDNYLQCKPIYNAMYTKKKVGWFAGVINSFLSDDDPLEFENQGLKPSSSDSIQNMVDNAIKYIFDDAESLQFANAVSSDNGQQNYSQFADFILLQNTNGSYSLDTENIFDVSTVGQSVSKQPKANQIIAENDTGVKNSNNLNRLVFSQDFKQDELELVYPDLVEVEIIQTKPIVTANAEFVPNNEKFDLVLSGHSKKGFGFKRAIASITAIGLLTYGLIVNIDKININNPLVSVKPTNTAIAIKSNPIAKPISYDPAAKIKAYDNVILNYISQDESVCNKLKQAPKAINYGDNKWFAVDNSKYHLCQIGKIQQQSKQLSGDKLSTFKQSNSATVMNAISKSNKWLTMSN